MLRISHVLSHLALRPGGTLVATVREERSREREARTRELGHRLFRVDFRRDGGHRRYRAGTRALDAVSERVHRANNA